MKDTGNLLGVKGRGITSVEEGLGEVVLNKTDYLAKAERQLSDKSTYQPQSHDLTSTFNADLSS